MLIDFPVNANDGTHTEACLVAVKGNCWVSIAITLADEVNVWCTT